MAFTIRKPNLERHNDGISKHHTRASKPFELGSSLRPLAARDCFLAAGIDVHASHHADVRSTLASETVVTLRRAAPDPAIYCGNRTTSVVQELRPEIQSLE